MRIFAGVPLGGSVKWEWGCRRRQFLAIWMATSSETSEIRPAILYSDMLPLVGCDWLQSEWPWAAMLTNLQFSRCYIFVGFGNNADIGLHYYNNLFWISAHTHTNKDDLESFKGGDWKCGSGNIGTVMHGWKMRELTSVQWQWVDIHAYNLLWNSL